MDAASFRNFERELRETIMTARDVAAQAKAQEQAKMKLAKSQAEERRVKAEEETQRKQQNSTAAPITGQPTPADDNNFFATYIVAHGGCRRIHLLSDMEIVKPQQSVKYLQAENSIEGLDKIDLFGKPVLEWSDADIEAALSFYRDCDAQAHANLPASQVQNNLLEMDANSLKGFERVATNWMDRRNHLGKAE